MTHTHRALRGLFGTGVIVLGLTSCDMDVTNPGLIDAAEFDPAADASTLSLSAQQLLKAGDHRHDGVVCAGYRLSLPRRAF